MRRYVTNIPGISPGLLAPVESPRPLPSWLPERSMIVPCGRNALYIGWKAAGFPPGTKVLVPSFVCSTVTRPLERAGAEILFFRTGADLAVDWDHASRLAEEEGPRAFLWYHYLGCSWEFEEAVSFCRRHGLFFIEDCAHALFARHAGIPVGSTGDFAIFSIRKSIPAVYAAAVTLNNPGISFRDAPSTVPVPPDLALYLKEREIFLYRQHLQNATPERRVAYVPYRKHAEIMEPFFRDDTFLFPVDETSLLVMHNVNPARVQANRERNFRVYLAHLGEKALRREITPGAAPIGFPIVVGHDRDRLRERLEVEGVESLIHWPGHLLPPGVAERFPETRLLADTCLSLPCHHDLSVEDILYVCETVKRLI